MRCFELLKAVLDRVYNRLPGEDDKEKDAQIRQKIQELRDAYADLRSGHDIDYSDPVTRFAYLFKYVNTHAAYLSKLVDETSEIQDVLRRQPFAKVASLGGGPGTETIGLTDFLMRHSNPAAHHHVSMRLFDREDLWFDEWDPVLEELAWLEELKISGFSRLDVIDREHWSRRTEHVQGADLFLAVYFLSELFAHRAEAAEYFEYLAANAKPGAAFFYLDNSPPDFTEWLDAILLNQGWVWIKGETQRHLTPPTAEEKMELKEYIARFDHRPKLQADVKWALFKKG